MERSYRLPEKAYTGYVNQGKENPKVYSKPMGTQVPEIIC